MLQLQIETQNLQVQQATGSDCQSHRSRHISLKMARRCLFVASQAEQAQEPMNYKEPLVASKTAAYGHPVQPGYRGEVP
ncbi:unnamed protein product [Durusdinium trenchii]|uniref:Uncharacterized protein n=1 Tax=Durusdinium trenchii TaxID=1381693 RepID=A0ABP0M4H5_9DINO